MPAVGCLIVIGGAVRGSGAQVKTRMPDMLRNVAVGHSVIWGLWRMAEETFW